MTIEAVGSNFNLETFFEARKKTIALTHEMANALTVGMTEPEAHELLKTKLAKYGSEKLWHPSKIRFGINTLKTFRDVSEPNITLKADEPFFLDLGPVFDGHEGDYGETFMKSDDNNRYSSACKLVFEKTAQVWREEKLTGIELYKRAEAFAHELGFELNHGMDGHRLGDFPHAVHFKGGLGEVDQTPIENLWILEIHLRDPKTGFGCFFEDLLT